MSPNPSPEVQRNPSGNPSRNPSQKGHFESRATPAPPHPTPPLSTSSGSDAQTRGRAQQETLTARIRNTPQAIALARLILDIRPDWNPEDVHGWALTDDRPWTIVVRAGIAGATDRGITRPAGLRHVGPQLDTSPPLPPTPGEHRRFLADLDTRDCGHGDLPERCPLCRRTQPQESA